LKKTDFMHLLRVRGLKATSRRVLLLKTLQETTRPLSVEAMRVLLKDNMNEVTVYRALEVLVEKGIAVRISLSNLREYYELAPLGGRHHHHLVCNGCGEVEDVDVPEPKGFEKSVLRQSKHFVQITSHSLEFFGKCRSCLSV